MKEIPGPQFLIYFLLYEAICTFAAWHLINNRESKERVLPLLTDFDSYAIAVLRGGWKTVVESVLYGLWKRDLIDIKRTAVSSRDGSVEAVRKRMKHNALNAVENLVYDFFHHKRNIGEAFQDAELETAVNNAIVSEIRELQTKHLLKRPEDIARAYIVVALTFCAIFLVGIPKLCLGLLRDKPLGFLLLILMITPFYIYFILKPSRPQTALGVSYLKSLKKKSDWMRQRARYDNFNGLDPSRIAAIFGVAAISADVDFARAANTSTGAYGGCGGGGGGCSGGGGCGGGCGGAGCGGCGGCGGS